MLRVYKTKNLEDEIGKAIPFEKGFEVSLHNGSDEYFLIRGSDKIGSFALVSDELALFLGQAEELYLDANRLIKFQTDEDGGIAYLHLDKDYYSIDELQNKGGLAA